MLLLFHISVVALNCFAIWYDQKYVKLPIPIEEISQLPLQARVIFLTFWCLVTQTLYFTIAILNDLFGTNSSSPKKPPIIRRIKDVLFTVTFTVAIYVFSTFWVLYTIDKRFMFATDAIEKQFPSWLNHTMHTLIAPFILIELIYSRRNYPSRKLGIAAMFVYYFAYISFLHYVYYSVGKWPYPFLDTFGWLLRTVFFACSPVLGIGFYILGEKLNSSVSSVKIKIRYPSAKKCIE